MSDVTITPDMTMEAILEAIPAGQRALFQRYHVGGCSSCGFQPTDTLAQVCKDHNILDVNEVVTFLKDAHGLDQKIQLAPSAVKALVDGGEDFSFIDVRSGEELDEGTFNKLVGSAFTVVVKFDKEYPYGEQHDNYKAVAEALSHTQGVLVGHVGIGEVSAPVYP